MTAAFKGIDDFLFSIESLIFQEEFFSP